MVYRILHHETERTGLVDVRTALQLYLAGLVADRYRGKITLRMVSALRDIFYDLPRIYTEPLRQALREGGTSESYINAICPLEHWEQPALF